MSWSLVATALCLLLIDVQPTSSSSSSVAGERRLQLLTPSQLGKKYFLGKSIRRTDASPPPPPPPPAAAAGGNGNVEETDGVDAPRAAAPARGGDGDRLIASYVASILREDIRLLTAALRCRTTSWDTVQRVNYKKPTSTGPWLRLEQTSGSGGSDLASGRRMASSNGMAVVDRLLDEPQQTPRQTRSSSSSSSSSRYASQMDKIARALATSGLYAPDVDDEDEQLSEDGSVDYDIDDVGSRSQTRQQEKVRLLNQFTRFPESRLHGQPRRLRYQALTGKRPPGKEEFLLNPLTRQMINRRQ